jgi:di/tricarboxylate transporter
VETAVLHVWIVVLTLLGAMVAFIRERFSPDVTALLTLLVLVITGVLTPAEGFAGFSHPATITVAAVLVLSASLERTGAFDMLARRVLSRMGRSEWVLGLVLMMTVGVLSAFINNTAAVAVFLPIVLQTCRRTGARPGRLLLPLSYAAMFGGLSTLIGTSTNIVVHEYARNEGLSGFSMFEFAQLGIPLFVIGILYMAFVGRWFLRRGDPVEPTERHNERSEYVVDVYIDAESTWIGKTADPQRFRREHDLELIEVRRGGSALRRLQPWPRLMEGDRCRVHGTVQQLVGLTHQVGLRLHETAATPETTWDTPGADTAQSTQAPSPNPEPLQLAEVVLLPESPAVGHTLETARLRGVYPAMVLGMRRAGHAPEEHALGAILHAGDALLLEATRSQITELEKDAGVIVLASRDKPVAANGRLALSLVTLAGVVVSAALGWLPIVTAASAGCLLLMMTGTLKPREAYDSINWQIIFMLAGVLALGTAMEKTGIASHLAAWVTSLSGQYHPVVAVALFYAMTGLLTQFMSNTASAALLVPVALHAANLLQVHPEPFLVAVAISASTSFATPMGYQTNLMVYGPGGYRFSDFVRVGLPLNFLFWAFSSLAIPFIWPL